MRVEVARPPAPRESGEHPVVDGPVGMRHAEEILACQWDGLPRAEGGGRRGGGPGGGGEEVDGRVRGTPPTPVKERANDTNDL